MPFLSLFRKPSSLRLATAELEDAQRDLLSASSAADYADAMCAYHTRRIERLRETIVELTAAEPLFEIGGK